MDLVLLRNQEQQAFMALAEMPKEDVISRAEFAIRNQHKAEGEVDFAECGNFQEVVESLADAAFKLDGVADTQVDYEGDFTIYDKGKNRNLRESGMVGSAFIELNTDDDGDNVLDSAREELFQTPSLEAFGTIVREFMKDKPYRAATLSFCDDGNGNYCLNLWLWPKLVGETAHFSW